jgi:hypothetical protein
MSAQSESTDCTYPGGVVLPERESLGDFVAELSDDSSEDDEAVDVLICLPLHRKRMIAAELCET